MYKGKEKAVRSLSCLSAALAGLCISSISVLAHQEPAGCSANNLSINIAKDSNNVTNGATVVFTVTIQNPSTSDSCNITLGSAGLVFTCPGPDGTPSGAQTNLIAGGTVLPGGGAGFGPVVFNIPCVINVNPGVAVAQAKVQAANALLHDNPLQDDPANIDKTVSVNIFNPCIDVTKECVDSPVSQGSPIGFRGRVTNCGNIALQNVVVVDGHAGQVFGPMDLAAGASATFTGSYTPAGCGLFTNTVTARGTAGDLDAPLALSDSASAVCEVLCPPDIDVTKEVACLLPSDTCGSFAKVATGVKDTACPAFCYRVTIRNTGPVPVVSLSVNDPALGGDLSTLFGPLPIAPGDSRVAIIKPIVHCQDTPNTVRAVGRSADGQTDTDEDSAEARVVNINIVCSISLYSSFNMDTNAACVILPESAPVEFLLTLKNTGTAPLRVTSLNGLPPLVDCNTGAAVAAPTLPINIAAGGSFSLVGCVNVTCPAGADFNVTAQAEADDSNGTLCVYDRSGSRVRDESSCSACVRCDQPVACRVTGGGVLIPGTSDQSCITVNTTILPAGNAAGLAINKITHGGQLGAPFSQMDCGEILGNACIRGQWSHTRHYQGTANPRDVFDMTFHTTNPKGIFDSLNCACLGCCDPETGEFISPVTVNGICNPDHRVCGPLPRPSPANAIIFSGIGRLTPTDDVSGPSSARAEWVVFRVYIEDRSEPGGLHPKGGLQPADIYCFQAWKTGLKVSKRPDYSKVATALRKAVAQANCDFLAALRNGTLPIGSLPSPLVTGQNAEIQDCGPLHDGNQQIHPATGAECP